MCVALLPGNLARVGRQGIEGDVAEGFAEAHQEVARLRDRCRYPFVPRPIPLQDLRPVVVVFEVQVAMRRVCDPAAVIEDPLHHQPLVPVTGIVLVPDQDSRSCAPSARLAQPPYPRLSPQNLRQLITTKLPAKNSWSSPWASSVSNDPCLQAGGVRDVVARNDVELVVGTGLGVGAEAGPLALCSCPDPSSRVSKPRRNAVTSQAVKLGAGATTIQGRSLEANQKT